LFCLFVAVDVKFSSHPRLSSCLLLAPVCYREFYFPSFFFFFKF
jgi:hypothetical protein